MASNRCRLQEGLLSQFCSINLIPSVPVSYMALEVRWSKRLYCQSMPSDCESSFDHMPSALAFSNISIDSAVSLAFERFVAFRHEKNNIKPQSQLLVPQQSLTCPSAWMSLLPYSLFLFGLFQHLFHCRCSVTKSDHVWKQMHKWWCAYGQLPVRWELLCRVFRGSTCAGEQRYVCRSYMIGRMWSYSA